MKRTALFLLMALCAASFLPAHGRDRRDSGRGRDNRENYHYHRGWDNRERNNRKGHSGPVPEIVKISGKLTVVQGMIAVENDGTTYLTRGLDRFTGFIDGLKEGAQVTLEGYAMPNPQNNNVKMMRVTKMTLNGKEYDLAPRSGNFPSNSTRQNRHRR